MGQYYTAVSLDAKEALHPFGAKLMEHSWLENSHMKQVERLLSPGNPWHKTRIVWAGDYMDEGIFLEEKDLKDEEGNINGLYSIASKYPLSTPSDGPDTRYILNHTKNIYIDKNDIPDVPGEGNEGWKIHPLSILTSSGNGRGGGDYRDEDDENVGSWAGDVISTEFEEPVGMEKFTAFFVKD